MARVSTNQLKDIITVNSSDGAMEHAFIGTATLFVDTYLLNSGLPEGILAKIELYLAAHLAAVTDESAGLIRDKANMGEMEWSDTFGQGFASSRFGQMALALDTSGTLASLTAPKLKAQFRVVSRDPGFYKQQS